MSRPYVGLLRALEKEGVAYAIAGGFAAVLHGVPRMTFDLDIVVDDAAPNMARLVAVLQAEGFCPRLPVALSDLARPECRKQWIDERNLIAFSLHHPVRVMEEVDVLLAIPFPWPDVQRGLVFRSLDGVRVPVVGRAQLRAMKLASGRDKDRADAAALEVGEVDPEHEDD